MSKIKAYGICLYKLNKNNTKVLLCKSVQSTKRWGFLKGVQENNETNKKTALREFKEESSINIADQYLEEYFDQINETKDIGIYLVNYDNITNIEKKFHNDKLESEFLSVENKEVKFFDIKDLPKIKQKQKQLVKDVKTFLKKGQV